MSQGDPRWYRDKKNQIIMICLLFGGGSTAKEVIFPMLGIPFPGVSKSSASGLSDDEAKSIKEMADAVREIKLGMAVMKSSQEEQVKAVDRLTKRFDDMLMARLYSRPRPN